MPCFQKQGKNISPFKVCLAPKHQIHENSYLQKRAFQADYTKKYETYKMEIAWLLIEHFV